MGMIETADAGRPVEIANSPTPMASIDRLVSERMGITLQITELETKIELLGLTSLYNNDLRAARTSTAPPLLAGRGKTCCSMPDLSQAYRYGFLPTGRGPVARPFLQCSCGGR